jgi:hypothetical protein
MQKTNLSLAALFFTTGVILWCTIIPGIFTIDETNHLSFLFSVRKGSFLAPGTEGIRSRELWAFDPTPRSRDPQKPIVSRVPPFHAFLAWPFSWMGWKGLVGLNLLAFFLAAAIVFVYARRYATQPHTAWLAVAFFLFGAYNLEYAQGMWPHLLSVALSLAAYWLASLARTENRLLFAGFAGFFIGIAAGVRYPNALLLLAIGGGLFLWSERRVRACLAYTLGAGLPLLFSSMINLQRFGAFHPLTKGQHYTEFQSHQAFSQNQQGFSALASWLQEGFLGFWSRIIDFSFYPPLGKTLHSADVILKKSSDTGAFLLDGVMKKAWLQSLPWILLVLFLLFFVVWLPKKEQDPRLRKEQKAIALAFLAVIGLYSFAGLKRTDGWSYNQRYFLELVPLASLVLAWSFDTWKPRYLALFLGILTVSLSLPLLLLFVPWEHITRQLVLLRTPYLLALGLLFTWLLSKKYAFARSCGWFFLGACFSWSLCLHLMEDLSASRAVRSRNYKIAQLAEPFLSQQPSALFAYWGKKDPFGILQLRHDLVIADPWIDGGREIPHLIDLFLQKRRRVFVYTSHFPLFWLHRITASYQVVSHTNGSLQLLEVKNKK